MAVEVEPSRQYSVKFFCRATDDSTYMSVFLALQPIVVVFSQPDSGL
jgi:hypothetical protein